MPDSITRRIGSFQASNTRMACVQQAYRHMSHKMAHKHLDKILAIEIFIMPTILQVTATPSLSPRQRCGSRRTANLSLLDAQGDEEA